jgi:hypothetical protein
MPTEQAGSTNRQLTNATARLSAILDKLNSNNTANPVADVLAWAFDIKGADPNRTFLLAYTSITRMLECSQKEVETYLSSELSFYGVHFQPLRLCFSPKSSGQPWNGHKSHLSQTDITGIRYTAQHLKPIIPEYLPTAGDLSEVLTAIDTMYQALDNEALSVHTRETLRECLDEIKRALQEYTIWGAAGLNQAFKVFTGTLVTDPIIQDDLRRDSGKGGSLWEKVSRIGGRILMLLSILQGGYNVTVQYLPALERLFLPDSVTSRPTVDVNPVPSGTENGAAKPAGTMRL